MNTKSINTLTEGLLKLVRTPINIRRDHLNGHLLWTFETIFQVCFNPQKNHDNSTSMDCIFEIDSVLNYLDEELNTGHWSAVPTEIRQNFTIGSFLKSLLLMELSTSVNKYKKGELLEQCLRSLDIGLLLGAPLEENPDLLMEAAKYLRMQLDQDESHDQDDLNKLILKSFTKRSSDADNVVDMFDKVNGINIETLEVPSIETFNRRFFVPQIPVKLEGCMAHWPATTKWLDINYLLQIAGNRTVPIEIGSHYTDENWSQKLMTVRDFIKKHYLSETGSNTGYLAQHNLFDQIGELKEDIRIPEYCCCSLNYDDSSEPDINAWFGPKGTVSPLHQDPKNNILTQVYGTKRVLLFSTEDSRYLYPHCEAMLSNTAQVDPLNPDLNKFPDYKRATMYKCLLEPGDMLFIPLRWWHHVTALEKSFSVSFWWQ